MVGDYEIRSPESPVPSNCCQGPLPILRYQQVEGANSGPQSCGLVAVAVAGAGSTPLVGSRSYSCSVISASSISWSTRSTISSRKLGSSSKLDSPHSVSGKEGKCSNE